MMQHFGAKNGLFAPNKNVFGKNDQYHFHLPIGPIHCAKFLKILTTDQELCGCAISGPK